MYPKKHKLFLVLILLGLLLNSSQSKNSVSRGTSTNIHMAETLNQLDEINLTIEINLIGYSDGIIDTALLLDQLENTFQIIGPSNTYVTLTLTYQFSFLESNVASQLATYIEEHGTRGQGVGYAVNTSLLQDDLATGQRRDIFIPLDGIAVNVETVEEYISTTLYHHEEHAIPGYTFYMLNLSSLDNPAGNEDHYYLKQYTSADTNRTVDFWYSGYNNIPPLQPLGWGGNERFCFIDLSARTWYFDWVKTAWPNLGSISPSYFEYPDIDSIANQMDITVDPGKSILHTYLAEWINSYAGNVFSAYYYALPIGKTYSLQTIIFNNLTDAGYPFDSLKWVISEARIRNQLERDIPWISWDVNVTYVNLADYPSIANYIKYNLEEDQDGLYLEVAYGFLDLLQNKLDDFFNLSAADTVLPCYAFLTDNIRFKYTGISFAGLGGMGWELLVGDQYSLFENGDITKPRRGMSATLIHELGHSLGMPHPHSYAYSWGSEFIAEIMSYFPLGEMQYSVFYRDGIGRAHGNYWYNEALEAYDNTTNIYADYAHTAEKDEELNQILDLINTCPELYNSMDYNATIITAQQAIAQLEHFVYTLEHPEDNSTEPTKSAPITVLDFLLMAITLIGCGIIAIKMKYR